MPNLPWTHRTLYQLTVAGLVFGQQVVNTFHFEAEATYDLANITDAAKQADSQLLALDWIANGKVPYLAQLPSDYAMQMITCQVLETNGQWRHRLTPMETAQTTSPGRASSAGGPRWPGKPTAAGRTSGPSGRTPFWTAGWPRAVSPS